MTTCHDCITAAAQPHHGFTAGCDGCCARAASRSPHYHRVRSQGRLDRPYQALLDHFGLTHAEVRAAAETDALTGVAA